MRPQSLARSGVLLPAVGVSVAVLLAACGSSTTSSTSKPTASASTASATAQITSNWKTFFNGKTPTSERVTLLQNGSTYTSELKSLSSLGAGASASVSKVTVTSPTKAEVTYSVLVGGSPVLKDQKGPAVKQDGTWKVGDQSFCSLLTLENGGKTPKICAGVGSAG